MESLEKGIRDMGSTLNPKGFTFEDSSGSGISRRGKEVLLLALG
jgi:hypothetical protein